MASSGPLSPSSVVDDAAVGSQAWTNPGDAVSSNDVRASATYGGITITHYLKATGFGFAIPAGATINGIVVEVERSCSGTNTSRDNRVSIVKGGTVGSTNKADTGTNWPTTDTYKTYGSSSDLWGETWTVADINASNFGLAFAASRQSGVGTSTSFVDHIRITVYYTAAAAAAGRSQVVVI